MKKLWWTINFLLTMKPSERELRFQRNTVRAILPFLSGVFLFVGWFVMPSRFGLNRDLLVQPNFIVVNILLIISGGAYLLSRLGYNRLSPFIMPVTFLIISLFMLNSEIVMAQTPFVPFYAAIVGIIMGATFLSMRQMSLYFLVFIVSFGTMAAMTPMESAELLHRSTVLILVTPFMFAMTVLRQLNFHDLEMQNRSVLETANLQSLAQLSGTVAHEINNPLAIITGHAHKLSLKMSKGTLTEADLQEGLNRINETVFRISKIIRGLRKISREDNNLIFETTTAHVLIEDAVAVFEESFRNRKIDFRLHLPKSDIFMECYPLQLTQVFINLVGNAIDALETYENLSDRWIEITGQQINDEVKFYVVNSGPKIKKEVESKIFTPFFTTKAIGKGTGLGLSLCKQIVNAHFGQLNLDLDGNYTTFIIKLPKTPSAVHSNTGKTAA